MENEPPQRYASNRDEWLHILCKNGWANVSNGSKDSSTGYFAKIVITEAEAPEVVEAFRDEAEALQLATDHGLIGNFLLIERPEDVKVNTYESEQALDRVYELMVEAYEIWTELYG